MLLFLMYILVSLIKKAACVANYEATVFASSTWHSCDWGEVVLTEPLRTSLQSYSQPNNVTKCGYSTYLNIYWQGSTIIFPPRYISPPGIVRWASPSHSRCLHIVQITTNGFPWKWSTPVNSDEKQGEEWTQPILWIVEQWHRRRSWGAVES